MSNVCRFSKGLCVLVITVSVLVLFAQADAASAVKELKWAVFVPESAYDSPPLKGFRDDIERYTNGAVKIRIFWPGQIAEVKEMVDLVKRGSIDMSTTAPTFYPSMFPLNVALQSFPMVFKSPEQSTYVWRGLFREFPELQKEFTAQNQYCLNRGTLALYLTLSKKPIRTAADLKGQKVRSLPGKYFSKIMEQAGAVPIVNPISEVYEGLMRGSLDAVMLNIQVFDTLKFYETAKYVSLSVGSPVGYWISINQDTWNGFTLQIREAFTRAATEWGAGLLHLVTSSAEASTKNLKEKGVQFVEFSQKEWEGMIARAGDPWGAAKDYLATDLRVNAGLADKFMKRWRELIDEYDKKYPAGKTWKYE
jgi:TRAP-type C4-dicarboxylate transport system substrate-binding protein